MPIELTPEQRATTTDLLVAITKALETNEPPPPSFNNGNLNIRAYDAYVAPGERIARVPVALNEPAKQTMVVRHLTANDTAIENSHFVRTDGYLLFHPGEQLKVVSIPIKQDLGSKKFKLNIGWPQNDPVLKVADNSAMVSGDKSLLAQLYSGPALPKPSGLMSRPANLDLVFYENFGSSFMATDSGFLEDKLTPCWRTRLSHGRTQGGNKEIGYYADEVVVPASRPIVNIDGKINLVAEYFPDGVKDVNGNTILCPWDVVEGVQQPFKFTAAVLTTQRLFPTVRRGSYVEGKMTMPLVQGCWPGFWMIASDLTWSQSYHEFDLFEGFFNNAGNLAQVGTTVHWRNSTGNHSMFSTRLPFLGVDLTQPQVWGMHWGDDAITFYCNDVPYMAAPNVFPDKDCFLKIDIAVGGQVAKPTDPASTFPARMPLEWVKVWQ